MKTILDGGRVWYLMEKGGPWVEGLPNPAPSGNPAEWTPVDRARMVLNKGDRATWEERTKALSDLIFAYFRDVEEVRGRTE